MHPPDVLELLRSDATAGELLRSSIPARVAYLALDGTPRAIPVAFTFTGEVFAFGSPAESPKVAALRRNPAVALTIDDVETPPASLLVRGTASVAIVDGVAPEYVAANRRALPRDAWEEFERQAAGLYEQMALITIAPTWARVFDFRTRIPGALAELVSRKGAASSSDDG